MSTKKFVKDSFLVTVLGICSRILGWIRDNYLLEFIGTGAFSDAFSLSVKIPTSFRKAFSEGAINSALLPKIRDFEEKNAYKRLHILIINTFMIFSFLLFVFYFGEQFFEDWFLSKVAPGFNLEQKAYYGLFVQTTSFTSFIYFCYSILGSLLQSRGFFFWPSISVILFNFCLICLIKFSLIFNVSVVKIVFFYFFATIIMLLSTMIPSVIYDLFQEDKSIKIKIASFLFGFIFLFIFVSFYIKFLLFIGFYCVYLFFANQNSFFSKQSLGDLRSLFYFFAPIFLIAILTQINDVISMRFASLFGVGSMTLVLRSGKIMQLPIAFIIPVFITLFSYLNKFSKDKKTSKTLKRLSMLFVFLITFAFMLTCFLFTEGIIKIIFFNKVSAKDVVIMKKLVKLYSISLPALLMNRLFQMFFFVEKSVIIPAIISLNNSICYVFLMKIFIFYSFDLSSVVYPFVFCSWITFFLYLILAYKKEML
ncbi:lipid II flippase MurJ [Alphaproteobacteria bacterium endosymbiont of Tiliacea citrago]|uniref:lipid II flippase MurJ n=1 Tax=Alphaproteobacteria bacterium endosymbiont of Tiliacea citrago TaxID=3077944 RepID=UPI00313C901B